MRKTSKIHSKNKRSRALVLIMGALEALDQPSTWRDIDSFLWENHPTWVRIAPTPNQAGAIMSKFAGIVPLGHAMVGSLSCGYSINTLWGLKEWLD